MYSYVLRRLAFGAVTVAGVSIVVFFVLRVLPGDPLVAIFGPEGFTKLTPEARASYMSQLGLSDPLVVQDFRWIGDILSGSLGHSYSRSECVAYPIARPGPLNAGVAATSGVLARLICRPVGVGSALRANSFG